MNSEKGKEIYLHHIGLPFPIQNRAVNYTIEALVSLYIAAENIVDFYKGLKEKLKI